MALDSLQEFAAQGVNTISNGIVTNPLTSIAAATGVGVVGGAIAGSVVTAAVIKRKRKKSVKSKRSKKRNSTNRKRRKRGRRTPRTAGKGKDRSTKRIRYTKNGQPYVITRSGKAKFIKKSSARQSHKKKGGRY